MVGMTPNHLTDLALTLDFTAEDLYANRNGILSERQRAKLQRVLLRDAILYGALEAVLVAIVLVMLGGVAQQLGEGRLIILAILVLAAVIYPIYIARQYRATRADLAKGSMQMAAAV
jgi:hypothetical protein